MPATASALHGTGPALLRQSGRGRRRQRGHLLHARGGQVSAAAAAVDVGALLLEATTGDGALNLGPQALAIRIENTYEQGGEAFWVDARVAWPSHPLTLTIANDAEPQVDYDVQAYLVHRHDAGAAVSRRMRSGHYVA